MTGEWEVFNGRGYNRREKLGIVVADSIVYNETSELLSADCIAANATRVAA